jgi:REP element-mobilizing transposase RayT
MMTYWRLFYHIVWATKSRQPLIEGTVEPLAYASVRRKSTDLNAILYAISGMPDHVHVIAAVPPTIQLAEYVRNLKGRSSHDVHIELGIPFEWQAGYGIFSISEKNLKQAIAYVENQKAHHLAGSIIPRFEHISEEDDSPLQGAS